MNLQNCIDKINEVLIDLKQRRAYNIEWPKYNRHGYNLSRLTAGVIALELPYPEDVPGFDLLVERYIPGELFWKLWGYARDHYDGVPPKDLEDHMDYYLNELPYRSYQVGTVLGQVAALDRIKNES